MIAFVQRSIGSKLAVTDLQAYARSRLSPYKVPHEIVFMETLPAAPSGKILKAQLKGLIDDQD